MHLPVEALKFRKDFGNQVFGAGNRRDKQFFEFDPKIERTLTKHRNRVKFQRALQGQPSKGTFSEEFSEEEIVEEVFQEEIRDNMDDNTNNN
ncbi:hypothetical protein PIB30_088305 [Stylosanthes scabra]|uniref:Uncharacterized protein n=1 Tax=Stylosanthes scabra TaxID=79078 RepID=A0ABU6WUY8_9FABA|nr:hypothetical protein [Stylosanthes scabra]